MTWTSPDSLDGVTGYRIDYSSTVGGSSSKTVNGANKNHYTLSGLTNGKTYTIYIAATSMYLVSKSVGPTETIVGPTETIKIN